MTTALIILVLSVPVLVTVFATQLVQWRRDISYNRWVSRLTAAEDWRQDWAWWTRRTRSTNPNTRQLARQMQAVLLAARPEDA
jgi:hypothetical protein